MARSKRKDGTVKAETVAAALPAVVKANAEGLTGFDASIIERQLVTAFEHAKTAKEAQEAKANAALVLCQFAHSLRVDQNAEMTSEDWSAGWRYEMKAILPRLHVAGIGWVDVRESKDKRPLYSLSNYGQNVSSTANQCGQYAESLAMSELESYTQVVKAIRTAKEAERAATLTEAEIELEKALTLFDEGMTVFAKQIKDSGALGVVERAIDELAKLIAREAIEAEKPVPVIGTPEPEVTPDAETPEPIAATA